MLIHITPQFLTCDGSSGYVDLVDLRINELGLFLKAGKEVAGRRPYRNKRFVVACRNAGRKAVDGILIETSKPVAEYTVETRWAVQAEAVVTHRVKYVVLDKDFDT